MNLPKFTFIEKRSSFNELFFEIEETKSFGFELIAELIVNIKTEECILVGRNELENVKIIPPYVTGLKEDVKRELLANKYVGYSNGFLSSFVFSKERKIIRNSKNMKYQEYLNWLNNNLIY